MTELESLKLQEFECKNQLANLVYGMYVCREKLDTKLKEYQKIKDKLSILEVEHAVNQLQNLI